MQFTELPSKGLERFFKVIVEDKNIKFQVTKELERLSATAAIPGFRAGKVPFAHIQKKYGEAVRADVLSQEIQKNIDTIVKEYKLDLATRPALEDMKNEAGKDVEFTVKFEVMPHVTLPNFKEIELTRPKLKVTEEDIKNRLDAIVQSRTEFTPSPSTKAKKGHQVLIDFVGSVDGIEFKGGAAENHKIILGSKSFIDGFEDQLVGTKAGDEIVVKVTFPKEYHANDLAGKDAEFKVTVHEVCTPNAPALDDAFAQTLKYKDLEDLHKSITDVVSETYDAQLYTILKMRLFDNLEKMLKFDIPASLAENEYQSLKQQSEGMEQEDGDLKHDAESLEEYYRRVSLRRVKIGLMLSEYVKTHNLTLEKQDLERALMIEARQFPGQEALIMNYYQNNKSALESLSGRALEDKAVRMIMANDIKMTDKLQTAKEIEKLIQEENDKEVV
ncbi:MAG: trigger factor [Pseudomonadota bacterium]